MYEEVCVRIAAFVRRANGCVLPWLGMRWVNTLIRCVNSHKVCALSFPGWWYDDIKEAFAQQLIALLTWEHRKTQLELFLTPRGRRMINDPQLKVVLVKDKGHFHR